MADGELNGDGLDIDAVVVVQVSVHSGLGWNWPVVETAEAWSACACAST